MKTIYNCSCYNRLSLWFLTFLFITMGFMSCNKNSNVMPGSGVGTFARVVNASQASAPQDIYIDNAKTNFTLGYGVATDYFVIPAITHSFSFNASSTTNTNSTASLAFNDASYYTVYYTDDNSTIFVQDDHTAPQTGKCRVSFVNFSSGVTTSVDFGITGGNKVISGLFNKNASGYYDIDAATTSFSLYSTSTGAVLLNIPVTLQAGHGYVVYVSGTTANNLNYHLLGQF